MMGFLDRNLTAPIIPAKPRRASRRYGLDVGGPPSVPPDDGGPRARLGGRPRRTLRRGGKKELPLPPGEPPLDRGRPRQRGRDPGAERHGVVSRAAGALAPHRDGHGGAGRPCPHLLPKLSGPARLDLLLPGLLPPHVRGTEQRSAQDAALLLRLAHRTPGSTGGGSGAGPPGAGGARGRSLSSLPSAGRPEQVRARGGVVGGAVVLPRSHRVRTSRQRRHAPRRTPLHGGGLRGPPALPGSVRLGVGP